MKGSDSMCTSRRSVTSACLIALCGLLTMTAADQSFAGQSGGVVAPENTRLRYAPNYSYAGGITIRGAAIYGSGSLLTNNIVMEHVPLSPLESVQGVPEPTGLAIISIAGGWFAIQRRFRRRTQV